MKSHGRALHALVRSERADLKRLHAGGFQLYIGTLWRRQNCADKKGAAVAEGCGSQEEEELEHGIFRVVQQPCVTPQ